MKLYRIFSWVFLLLLAGCSENKAPGPMERPIPVIVTEIVYKDVPVYIDAIGNISAFKTAEIRPQVSGKLIDVRIKGGDDVKAGDTLYKIDPLPFVLALEREEANLLKDKAELEFARKKVERYTKISESDYISKLSIEEYKKAVSALEGQIGIDEANIGTAKNNLSYCTIKAPFDGRINLQKLDLGNVVSPSDTKPLATLYQITPINVYFTLAQNDFEHFQELLSEGKNQIKVILPGTKKEFEGFVTAFDSQVDLKTGTIQIKGQIANEDKVLWPGEFVKVHVFVKILKDVIVVPSSAIQIGQQGSYLYALKPDMSVQSISVKLLEQMDGFQAIGSDALKPGMKVVTDGQVNLSPGARVIVTKEAPLDIPESNP